MKVVLTGANGQLGRCLQDVFPEDWEVHAFGSVELGITTYDAVDKILAIKPNIIINAAAYTKVDLAETEIEQAYAVNATGVYHLAKAAQECNARLIHVSTDYVFDGTKKEPYTEIDATCPINVYGQSKLAGENLALATHVDTLILRTSWVFSEYGSNFLKTMLKLGESRKELRIVGDQIGAPTYAGDIAKAIIQLIIQQQSLRGILNVSGKEICSWAEFARMIFAAAHEVDHNYVIPNITAISTEEYPTAAKRPLYSVLTTTLSDGCFIEINSLNQNIQKVIYKLASQI